MQRTTYISSRRLDQHGTSNWRTIWTQIFPAVGSDYFHIISYEHKEISHKAQAKLSAAYSMIKHISLSYTRIEHGGVQYYLLPGLEMPAFDAFSRGGLIEHTLLRRLAGEKLSLI